jgi:predicted enzyme related to lactoylglutathione lyase
MSGAGFPAWIEIPSTDLQASRAFYTELFGWNYEVDPDPAFGGYTLAISNGEQVAGLYQPTEPGTPNAWMLYLETPDINGTAQQVADLGGTNLAGPMEIPGQGHALVSSDPTGAVIGFWQPTGKPTFGHGRPGTVCWAELNTRDGGAADKFYTSLFGYDQQQVGDGVNFDYTVWSIGGQQAVGRMKMGDEQPAETPAHWNVYIAVDPERGTDAVAEKAVQLGGKLLFGPDDSPYGRIAVVQDHLGAMFSIFDPSRTVQDGPGAQ